MVYRKRCSHSCSAWHVPIIFILTPKVLSWTKSNKGEGHYNFLIKLQFGHDKIWRLLAGYFICRVGAHYSIECPIWQCTLPNHKFNIVEMSGHMIFHVENGGYKKAAIQRRSVLLQPPDLKLLLLRKCSEFFNCVWWSAQWSPREVRSSSNWAVSSKIN